MKLTLHLGTSKTGTSAIQEAFFQSAQRLAEVGVYYDTDSSDYNVLEVLFKDESKWCRHFKYISSEKKHENYRRARGIVANIKKALLSGRFKHAIVSGETLFRLTSDEIERLLDTLYLPGLEIRTVTYVRRPSAHWISMVQQRLKASSVFKPATGHSYQIKRALEAWGSFSKIEAHIVRPYDRRSLTDGNVVADFVEHCVPEAKGRIDTAMIANESLSAEAAILMQHYRKWTHPDLDERKTELGKQVLRAVMAADSKSAGTKLQAKPQLLDIVDAKHLEDVKWLEKTFGVKLIDDPELRRLEAFEFSANGTTGNRIEDICVAYDPDKLDRLACFVMHQLAMGLRGE